MAIVKRGIVKKWFKRFSKPTELQFSNFFDSIWFKDETIPFTKIENLNTLLIKKADKELVDALIKELVNFNKPYDLSFKPTFLNYKYFGEDVYGVLLEIPSLINDTYTFIHDFDISEYLKIEVWEEFMVWDNPKKRNRQELTELVYGKALGIGKAKVNQTTIGSKSTGAIKLDEYSIEVTGNYRFPANKLLYVEFLKNSDQTSIITLPPRGGGNNNQK